ncbi:MAG: hypothetical protein NTW87_16370 [Planctomycetota bacterium]|nr:hypothetical protein [Planctomycetota bacterium]
MSEGAPPAAYQHTAFPQQLVIETTAACNQQCVFCGRTYMGRPKRSMKRTLFDKIVEEVGRENPYAELWPAFMGEAMLLGDRLFDAILYARKSGCRKITLNTNGTLVARCAPLVVDTRNACANLPPELRGKVMRC